MLVKTRTLSFGAFTAAALPASFDEGFTLALALEFAAALAFAAPFAALLTATEFAAAFGAPFAALLAAPEFAAPLSPDAAAGFFPRAASYTSYCRYKCWSCVKTCVMLGTSSV